MGGPKRASLVWRALAWLGGGCLLLAPAAIMLLQGSALTHRQLVLVWLIFAGLVLCAIAFFLRRAIRPWRDLTRAAAALDNDEPPQELPIAAAGAIGELARSLAGLREKVEDLQVALRESESRYRLIFDAMTDGLLLLDQDGSILAANPRLAETHGWTSQQLSGRSVTCLLRGEDHALVNTLRTPPADRPAVISGWTCDREGRERETEIRAIRLMLQGRPHALVILHDVAAQRRLERQLLLAQKYETVGDLAGGIAHDFNNLLTPVLGYSEMLLANPELSQEARADLQAIQRAGERARVMARRLLAYCRPQIPAVQTLDLGRTLAACESLLRQTLRKDIELVVKLPEAVCLILADPGQLEQMLMNLAINAMDAMPGGGRLEIELDDQETESAGGAHAPAEQAATCHRLLVRDTGSGIAPALQDRVCEPLFSTKSHGTGMGLAIVQNIVNQHHGSLAIRNRPAGGCEIEILLPGLARAPAADQKRSDGQALPRGKGETVILVEDDLMVRRLIETMLDKHGYAVRAYGSGQECLDDLAARPAPADLLLADVVMPGLSGPQLRDRLAASGLTLPTLLISGYSGQTLQQRGLFGDPAGQVQTDFLQKPLTAELLLGKLHVMLAPARR